MKKLSLLTLLVLALGTFAQAAPALSDKDVSEDSLKAVGTDRQKASIDAHNAAVKRAEKQRQDEIAEAKKLTESNDRGLKKTIQKRHLNTMLPPCEREPEGPREPIDNGLDY